MCGITGVLTAGKRPDPSLLRAMTDSIAHRGPDGDGFHIDDHVGLGHRRLAIIDLATGDQPMWNARRDRVIVFNGEIYNYLELKAELEGLGHTFRTTSDTEVILEAYERWGLGAQNRLNGMWALALWDLREKRLVLSRDRLGEKPMFWALHDGALWFGSEIKALLAGGVPDTADRSMLEVYMVLGYIPAPHTGYRGIHKLPAGHSLVMEPGGTPRITRYWGLPDSAESDFRTDRDGVDREFERLFDDSVRIRMRSDVPFGAFLSGGLDSSSVVSSMVRHAGEPVSTFTVGFDDRDFDERALARTVAQRFNTRHHEEMVEPAGLADSLERVLHHTDEPFGDSSAIPTGQVSRVARRHVKMVLTGDGGDEVLSGYTNYQGEKFAATWRKIPGPLRALGTSAVRVAGGLTAGRLRYRVNRVRNVLYASGKSDAGRLIDKMSWAPLGMVRALLRPDPERVRIEDFIDDILGRCRWRDPFYRLMYFHLTTSLPDDMLAKVDRMSMAASLESRVPFLDHRLVELMVGVHKDLKMEGYERKSVLRRTIGRRLPPEILGAPKKGFTVPLRAWFAAPDAVPILDAARHALRDIVDPKGFDAVVEANRKGHEDLGNFLWMLTIVGRWNEAGTADSALSRGARTASN